MTTKQMRWAAAPAVALLLPCLAAAQEVVWRAVARTPERLNVVASTPTPPAGISPGLAPAALEPAASLGRPIPIAGARAPAAAVQAAGPPVVAGRPVPLVRGQAPEFEPLPDPLRSSLPPDSPPGAEALAPAKGTAPVQQPIADPPNAATHTVAQPPPDPPPPPAAPLPGPDPAPGMITDRPVGPTFWEKTRGWFRLGDRGVTSGRACFQSDHCFDGLVSPVTQPFYFEDPRALTELRPIFMYQSVANAGDVHGGNLYFFGTQARVAFTENFSLVLNELGFLSFSPKNSAPPIQNGSGFAEIKVGPKWTFLRSSDWGSVAALGLTFEVPAGDRKIFQNTGQLSLDPYLSFGQTFPRLPAGFGTINFLGTLGYNFGTDKQRSDFFHLHLHADYNVANIGLYPLIELNWLHYTGNGNNPVLAPTGIHTEGADLINFGSQTRRGSDYLSLAFGARYRFTDCIFAGGAIEFPLSHERGLNEFRVTFDLIFRY